MPLCPELAERILALTENKQTHRFDWEKRALDEQAGEVRRGQWMGFLLGIGMIAGAVYCAIINQPWVAGSLVGATLTSVVTAFLRGRGKDE